ncbi:HemK2/MTQ2 family protein methyltransferase [Streptomyces sp. NRRL F-2890]|uniref:HemK2/MTQ2 family protein methyltransferase n=1 Tax=Streptomyces sp. NRRL F-2890 TaxID=1463845 RepID=UPI0004CBFF24|nr:HemK2/MTQ2 family protein methyltransferase [Streptomyces sp. NRRL F-2890]
MTTTSPPALGRVLTVPGVYPPQYDSRLMAGALARERTGPGTAVLDLCTGSGVLAVRAALTGADVTAVDIARRAVLTARLNALLARVTIDVRRGDLAASLRGLTFDLVVSNPPYVPAPPRRPARHGARVAWDAGADGRTLLDRICATAPGLLRPRGVLLLVHSTLCGTEDTLLRLQRSGLHATVGDRARIPLGPVLRQRAPWLRAQGLLEHGQDEEELVVIRAERL